MPAYAARINHVERGIQKLLNEDKNTYTSAVSLNAVKELGRHLLDLNRYICGLEGIVGISRGMVHVSTNYGLVLTRLTGAAMRLACASQTRLAVLVQQMVKLCQTLSQETRASRNTRKLAKAFADFYPSLLASKPLFANTFLEHPMLLAAVKESNLNGPSTQ